MALTNVPKQRTTIHHKKRVGQHHKSHTRHYAKTYWPYLPIAAIIGIGMFVNSTMAAGRAVLGYATSVAPTTLLSETNLQRSQDGKSALVLNGKLSSAAQAKANDMVTKDYWSHVSPDGTQPWQFINNVGYVYLSAGENLAYGFDTSNAAVAGWMNSPGHRANILNGNYTEVGFGIANGANYQKNGEQTIIVAMYGQPQTVAKNAPVSVSARVGDNKLPATPAPTPQATEPPAATQPTTEEPASATPSSEAKTSDDTVIAGTANDQNGTKGSEALDAQAVSRIDVLTNGQATWAAIALALIAGLSMIIFFVRHARLWRKLWVHGEQFVIHHPVLDIAFVFVGVVGFLLTRTSGFIH